MKLADNIAEHTFRLWVAAKTTQPQPPESERRFNGQRQNATQLTEEQAALKIISTAKA